MEKKRKKRSTKKKKRNKKNTTFKGLFERLILFLKKYRKAILIIAILLAFVIPFCIIRNAANKYSYDGLDQRKEFPISDYDEGCFYQDDFNLRNYKKGKVVGIPGIDVSKHQGEIDWKKVKNSGVKFAIVQLGYSSCNDGRIYMDPYFEKNVDGAEAAGLKVGVYFFSQAITTEEAVREAKFVIDNIKNRKITMPVAFDMEPVTGDDRINQLSVTDKTKVADAFLKVIKKAGYEPMIYGNGWWIDNNYDLGYLSDYGLWLASYGQAANYRYKYKMWQYADWGRINGIENNVDLNVYFEEKGLF